MYRTLLCSDAAGSTKLQLMFLRRRCSSSDDSRWKCTRNGLQRSNRYLETPALLATRPLFYLTPNQPMDLAIFLYLVPRGLRIMLPRLEASPVRRRIATYMAPFEGVAPVRVEKVTPPHQPDAKWPVFLFHLGGGNGHPTSATESSKKLATDLEPRAGEFRYNVKAAVMAVVSISAAIFVIFRAASRRH